MLRSPARYQHTARKLVECYRVHADGSDPCLRDAVARAWLNARGKSTRVIHLPSPGPVWAGYRNGYNTTLQNCYGQITWNEWVKEKYA